MTQYWCVREHSPNKMRFASKGYEIHRTGRFVDILHGAIVVSGGRGGTVRWKGQPTSKRHPTASPKAAADLKRRLVATKTKSDRAKGTYRRVPPGVRVLPALSK